MENYYFNTTELWNGMNRDLAVLSRTVSRRYLPPVPMLPILRLKLLSYLQNYLTQWEEIDDRIHPNAPPEKKWLFDRIGNILRSALLQLRNPNITNDDLYRLSIELKFALKLSGQIDKEFLSYVVIMSDSAGLFSNPWISRNRFSSLQNQHLGRGGEDEMANFVPKLRGVLDIHEKNAIDLLESMARNPDEPTLKRKYEMEVASYKRIAKQLKSKGEKIDDSLFEESKIESTHKKTKTASIAISKSKNKSSTVSSNDPDKRSESKTIEKKTMNHDIASIRDSIVECLEPFKKNIAIDAHELLKNAIESRFEILLFRVNHIIDEREQIGEDSYYVLEAAKMLDMSVRRLRQNESVGKSKEVTSFLNVAIDMLNK